MRGVAKYIWIVAALLGLQIMLGAVFSALEVAPLALMVFGSLLPQRIIQALVSFDQSYWHARSPELLHSPLMETLVWLRVPGDVIFAAGAVLLLVFLARLELGKRSA